MKARDHIQDWLSIGGAVRCTLIVAFLLTAPTAAAHLIQFGGEAVREVFQR